MIEAPYVSAVAALAGTIAGCATSIVTSWFASRSQSATKRLEHEINSKHLLYDKFIDEASKVYIHALEHDSTEVRPPGSNSRRSKESHGWLSRGLKRKRKSAARRDIPRLFRAEYRLERTGNLHGRRFPVSLEVSKLVNLYSTLNEIRVVSSSTVSLEAEKAVREIISTYSRENKTFVELLKLMDEGFPDPLRAFSEACRQELSML